jgi:hypothetical protein
MILFMGNDGKVVFRLRKDMPSGFKKNEEYPELPGIHSFLSSFEEKEFESISAFKEQVLDGFLKYLEVNAIPEGNDPKLRKGLEYTELDKVFYLKGDRWDYEVFTPATNGPGICVFGGLEKLEPD